MTSTSEIPTHWRRTTLGELCNGDSRAIQTGPFGSQLHASDYRDSGVPVVNPTHLRVNAIDVEHLPFVSKEIADQLSRHYLRVGDILISRRGDFSRYSYIGDKQDGWLCGTGCLRIRLSNPAVDNRFLAASFSLKSVQSYLSHAAVGSIMPNLNTNILRDVPIALPPVDEQRAISDIVDNLRSALNAWCAEVILERERRAALMDYVFSHGTLRQRTQQTEVGEIPETWQVIPLGSVCESSAFGPRFGAELYSKTGNVAVLRTTDFDDDGNINYATVPCAQLDLEKFEAHLLEPGDLLITRSGTCGIASLFQGHSKPVLPGAFLIRFRFSSELDPQFLRQYLNSTTGRVRVQRISSGAIQKNLTSTALLNLCIPLPPLIEQESIVKLLACCEENIRALERESELIGEVLEAMLEELMSGRVCPSRLIGEHQLQ